MPTLVVLQSVQPLTIDPAGAWTGPVRVLTDSTGRIWRGGCLLSAVEVVVAPRQQWGDVLGSWLRQGMDLELVTNDEYCLEECARLRDRLGMPRRLPRHVTRYLDKVAMKAALRAAWIDVPSWTDMSVVPAPDADPPGGLAFPVVVKPRQEANSRGVRVLRDRGSWRSWLEDHQGERGWEVEERIDAPMHFVDGVVDDGRYKPVLVGSYFGPLLAAAGDRVLGAVSVPSTDPAWAAAARLGESVLRALGSDGRFVTHLEFFSADRGLVVLEVAARAPGAMVSEMGRVALGVNLEVLHLQLQAGLPKPFMAPTAWHSSWISVLARPGQAIAAPPTSTSRVEWLTMPEPQGITGRYVAAMGLLWHPDRSVLVDDTRAWQAHPWVGDDSPSPG